MTAQPPPPPPPPPGPARAPAPALRRYTDADFAHLVSSPAPVPEAIADVPVVLPEPPGSGAVLPHPPPPPRAPAPDPEYAALPDELSRMTSSGFLDDSVARPLVAPAPTTAAPPEPLRAAEEPAQPTPAQPAATADTATADPGTDDDRTVVIRRAPRAPRWELEVEEGPVHDLRTTTIFGRRPSTTEEHPAAELIRLADPDRALSRRHALIDITAEGAWLVDLGSTNGTIIVTHEGTTPCEPHVRYELFDEQGIDFGGVRAILRRSEPGA